MYLESDIFVFPTQKDHYGVVLLEAMSAGLPLVGTRSFTVPELIKDGYNGFLIPRKTVAYIEKIKYFKQNPKELVRMGNNARKTIEEEWTWELMSRNYLKMFDEIFNIKRDISKYENPALGHLKNL